MKVTITIGVYDETGTCTESKASLLGSLLVLKAGFYGPQLNTLVHETINKHRTLVDSKKEENEV